MASIIDNGGFVIGNMGDAKYPKDSINLRTLQRYTSNITGGTGSSGAYLPLSGGTVTGNTKFSFQMSANVILSGTSDTNLYNIFSVIGHQHSISDITNLQNELNTKSNLSGATFTGNVFTPNLSGNSISATTLSGGTIYSGSTDLYNIFLTSAAGNDITRVQPGVNITTGGTANNPIINLIDSPSVNNLNASGLTNLQETTTTAISASTLTDTRILFAGPGGGYNK